MIDPALEKIILRFPAQDDPFPLKFSKWIKVLGAEQGDWLELNSSKEDFYPKILLDFRAEGLPGVRVDFSLSGGETFFVSLENVTGENRQSPHAYSYLTIEQVIQRLAERGIALVGVDHVGCNLPWFASGLHPQIRSLREKLILACLYHRFPTGEAWDFILPGDLEEIGWEKPVDYSRIRRPKFEVVSFEKSSIPLVQFDVQLNASYEMLLDLFPEALNAPNLRNLWIYLENPYGIDVCVVANPYSEEDWSDFFKNSRLMPR